MTQQAVTANLLGEGRVAFLTWNGDWSYDVADSHVAASEEESEWLLDEAQRAVAAQIVVDPYLIEVETKDGKPWPVKRREQIRAVGPTGSIKIAQNDVLTALRKVA